MKNKNIKYFLNICALSTQKTCARMYAHNLF